MWQRFRVETPHPLIPYPTKETEMADEKLMDVPTELDLALRQLEWSLDALVVQPLGTERPGWTPEVKLEAGDTESGYTCNFKCGDTAYWECPPFTTSGNTCTASCDGPCTTQCPTGSVTSPCACPTGTITNCTHDTCDVTCP
jgi:hypothetical protein